MSTTDNSRTQSKAASGDMQRLLCFSLGNQDYAIPLLGVREVIAIPDVTSVPYTPSHFLGIMNLRGLVISVIDLCAKLGLKKSENQEEAAVIIVDLDPVLLGVTVDAVNSVLNIPASQISPPPDIESKKGADYISGVVQRDKNLMLLLDIGQALDMQDLKAIRAQASNSEAA